MNHLTCLEERLGYTFRDKALLRKSLCHSSSGGSDSNERLEFLGDRVLGLVIAQLLYVHPMALDEGDLARCFNMLVKKESCAHVARELGLGEMMILSRGEKHTGGQKKDTILADACEAVIAAVYLDGGWNVAFEVVKRLWAEMIQSLKPEDVVDPKTALQEWAQSRGHGLPVYTVVGREGPDHQPIFELEVKVGKYPAVSAKGTSRRFAEREAARAFLEKYQGDVPPRA